MASTFSTHLNLELMTKGEKANEWGTITNDNLSAIDAEFALKSQDNPTQSAIGQHQPFVGQQVWASAEKTLYICATASNNATASSHYHLIHKMQGIDATAASAVVVDITGGDAQAGHVSISGGLNVTGIVSAGGIALNSATFSAITVFDTVDTSFLKATDANFTSVSAGDLRVTGTASIQSLHVSATACIDGPLFVSGAGIFDGNVQVGNLTATGNIIASGCVQAGTLAGNFTFSGDLSATEMIVGGSLSVVGTANFKDKISASGTIITGGNFRVGGISTLEGAVHAKADVSVGQDLIVAGTITAGNIVSKDGLAVSGSATILGALDVGGSVSVGGNMRVTGALSADDTFFAGGKATFDAGQEVIGNVSVKGAGSSNVIVSGCVQAGTIAGAFTFSGNLSASSVIVGKDLSVSGASRFVGLVSADDEFFVSGTAQFKGVTTAVGAVHAKSSVSIGSDLRVVGTVTIGGDLVVGGAFAPTNVTAAGNIIAKGSASVGQDLHVAGTASIGGNALIGADALIGGNINVSGQAIVSGNTQLKTTMTAVGKAHFKDDVSVSGALHVDGIATLSGNTFIKGSADLANDLRVAGTASIGGALDVGGATQLTGVVSADNDLHVGGALHVGGDASLETATFNGKVTASAGLAVVGTLSVGGDLKVDGTASFNDGIKVAGSVIVAGTVVGSAGGYATAAHSHGATGIGSVTTQISKAWVVMASGGTVETGHNVITASCGRVAQGRYSIAYPDFSVATKYSVFTQLERTGNVGAALVTPIVHSQAVGSAEIRVVSPNSNGSVSGLYDSRIHMIVYGTLA